MLIGFFLTKCGSWSWAALPSMLGPCEHQNLVLSTRDHKTWGLRPCPLPFSQSCRWWSLRDVLDTSSCLLNPDWWLGLRTGTFSWGTDLTGAVGCGGVDTVFYKLIMRHKLGTTIQGSTNGLPEPASCQEHVDGPLRRLRLNCDRSWCGSGNLRIPLRAQYLSLTTHLSELRPGQVRSTSELNMDKWIVVMKWIGLGLNTVLFKVKSKNAY